MTRFKICCISSVEEARLVINYGASALGLVSDMPGGPGIISEDLIETIAETIPPGVASFLLTSRICPYEIIEQLKKAKTGVVQIVDETDPEIYQTIRKEIPWVKIVQVAHVLDNYSVNYAIKASEKADAILLDSGNPKLKIKELGGTGRIHNWELSSWICANINKPVFLAGGLNPENVAEAVIKVNPFGVDVCSGVRTNGKLDEEKLARFVENLKMEKETPSQSGIRV